MYAYILIIPTVLTHTLHNHTFDKTHVQNLLLLTLYIDFMSNPALQFTLYVNETISKTFEYFNLYMLKKLLFDKYSNVRFPYSLYVNVAL